MKTKKYALLMALAVLGTGSVVFASAAEPAIDFDNIGSNDFIKIGKKGKVTPYDSTNEKEVKEKIKKKLSDRLGCDDLAVLAGDNNCAEWMKNLASEVLSSKKPIEFAVLKEQAKKSTKKRLDVLLYTWKQEREKYDINNYSTYNKVAYNFFDEKYDIYRNALSDLELATIKSESDRRIEEMRSQSPTSHSSNFSFKTEDSPPPSAKKNGVDTSNLDFSDFEKTNEIYWKEDVTTQTRIAQNLKDYLQYKGWDEICGLYKKSYNTLYTSWYRNIVWDVINFKEDQHLKDLESKCESMDIEALNFALSEAEEKRSKGTGDGAVYYTYCKETDVIEKVLKSKKEKDLEEKALKEKALEIKTVKEEIDAIKERTAKLKAAKEEIDAIKERTSKLKNEAKKASPDSEPKSKYKSPKKGFISSSISRYLSLRIKDKRIREVLRDIKIGKGSASHWSELKNYLYSDLISQNKIKQIFRGLKSRSPRILNEKYRFLNSLIPFSEGGSGVSFQHFIGDMAKEDAHLFPLRACAYGLRKKFANSDGSLSDQESNILEDFSRNDVLFTEYTNDLMDLYTSTIEDIIHAQTGVEDDHASDEKQQKIKKILSRSITNKALFIKKIKDFQRENDVDCSSFLNILKSLDKEERRKISEIEEDPEEETESEETNNAEDENNDAKETKNIKKTDAKKSIALKKVGAKNNKKNRK